METERDYLRDNRPEAKPVEEIEAANAKLVETARIQLEQIQPSLRDLTQRIIDEKPDMVVFLDKGARILATSVARFLRRESEHLPEIRFYNDDKLKSTYLHFQDGFAYPDNYDQIVEQDFSPYKGKKVFFIDETFSFGKGAAALSNAIENSGVDGYYFALTKDPDPEQSEDDWDEDETHQVSYSQMQDAIGRLRDKGKVKIYDNNIGYLFTKDAARLYVINQGRGQTASRYEIIPEDKLDEEYDYSIKPGKFPNARAYMLEYADRDWKEYDRQVRLSNRRTVGVLKNEITNTLNKA
jgi:adenine/guanine phosphoribosyltransferase-like PRPP-binding protein